MDFREKEIDVYVDVEDVADNLEYYLEKAFIYNLGYTWKEIGIIDKNKILKAVGQYWANKY